MSLRFRLVQCRDAGDPVLAEEVTAFASAMGVAESALLPYDALSEPLDHASVTAGVDAVLVGGSGRYSVLDDTPWMPRFIGLLGELAAHDTPTFASCFGFQGLVLALGGDVQPVVSCSEVGSFEVERTSAAEHDPLLDGLPGRFVAQMGHKDSAVVFPREAVHLLSSARCRYQALRVGRAVYATQFHPELTVHLNRARFQRYESEYSKAFGQAQAASVHDAFRPSPEASELLPRFVRAVFGARA